MSELNEKDLKQVSGGIIPESDLKKQIEHLYREIVANNCGGCQRADKSNCHEMLMAWCENAMGASTHRRCPMKQ